MGANEKAPSTTQQQPPAGGNIMDGIGNAMGGIGDWIKNLFTNDKGELNWGGIVGTVVGGGAALALGGPAAASLAGGNAVMSGVLTAVLTVGGLVAGAMGGKALGGMISEHMPQAPQTPGQPQAAASQTHQATAQERNPNNGLPNNRAPQRQAER